MSKPKSRTKAQRVLKLVLHLLDRPHTGAAAEDLMDLVDVGPRTLRRYMVDVKNMDELHLTFQGHGQSIDRYYLKRQEIP